MANPEQPDYVGPNTASLLQQLREIREYREERETARLNRPTQPSLTEIMTVLQQLVIEVAQLRAIATKY